MRVSTLFVSVCVLLALPVYAGAPAKAIPSHSDVTSDHAAREHAELIKIEAPHIIQQGDKARVAIRAAVPAGRHAFARKMYLIVDGSARPVAASMTLDNNVGPITFDTRLAIQKTTRVRGVVELSDGTRASAERTIKVTRGGYIALSGSSANPLPLNVIFGDSATQAALTDLLREVRGRVVDGPSMTGIYRIEIAPGVGQAKRAHQLQGSSLVKSVEKVEGKS